MRCTQQVGRLLLICTQRFKVHLLEVALEEAGLGLNPPGPLQASGAVF